jgi:hypothetical protein
MGKNHGQSIRIEAKIEYHSALESLGFYLEWEEITVKVKFFFSQCHPSSFSRRTSIVKRQINTAIQLAELASQNSSQCSSDSLTWNVICL